MNTKKIYINSNISCDHFLAFKERECMITDNRSVHADCLKAILIQWVVIPNRLGDFDGKDLWKPTMFYTNNLQYSVFFAQLVF